MEVQVSFVLDGFHSGRGGAGGDGGNEKGMKDRNTEFSTAHQEIIEFCYMKSLNHLI